VAYIRFASVYRSFADIESFESALKELKWDLAQIFFLLGFAHHLNNAIDVSRTLPV
jgi:hypothetical protein